MFFLMQSNVFREFISEEDLADTPIEEVQAYLEALKERRKMTMLIQQMRTGLYDEDEDDSRNLQSVNLQTRQQARNTHVDNKNGEQGF